MLRKGLKAVLRGQAYQHLTVHTTKNLQMMMMMKMMMMVMMTSTTTMMVVMMIIIK